MVLQSLQSLTRPGLFRAVSNCPHLGLLGLTQKVAHLVKSPSCWERNFSIPHNPTTGGPPSDLATYIHCRTLFGKTTKPGRPWMSCRPGLSWVLDRPGLLLHWV